MGESDDGMDPDLVKALMPYLTESVMVVRRDWTVPFDLGPPEGMLGHGPATGVHPFSIMHPDDVERVASFAQQAMESEPGWHGHLEARLQHRDGDYRLFEVDFHNRLDDPLLQGIVVRSRQAEHIGVRAGALPDSLGIEVLSEHLPVGLVLLDPTGRVTFANKLACDLLDVQIESLEAGEIPPSLDEVDRQQVVEIVRRLCAHPGRETFTCEVGGPDGRVVSMALVSRAGPATAGGVQYVIVTIEEITNRRAREQHLEHRANHDSLTGLPNRAWLLDHLHDRLAQDEPLLVAFVDLDGFKGVNDRMGHAAGDDVLAAVAGGLAAALEPHERVARVGGDEFVVVAPLAADGGGGVSGSARTACPSCSPTLRRRAMPACAW